MDQSKKISFGFSKQIKKTAVIQPLVKKEVKKTELIECLEGSSIKIKNEVKKEEKGPLVILMKDSSKNLLDRVKEAKASKLKVGLKTQIKEEIDVRPDSELTLDELAARELIKDAQKKLQEGSKDSNTKVFTLPQDDDKPIFEGKPEPTLNDYEDVPISDYGLAMLRGMGWKDGMSVGKNPVKLSKISDEPELRPKGLGLGANKMVKLDKKEHLDKNGKELILKKDTFAKIIAGNKRGTFCQVQGLDDEACRVIVKTIKGEILTLNEFLVIPVTKEEFSLGSKVINNAKYEEYKKKSDIKLEKQSTSSDTKNNREYLDSNEKNYTPKKYDSNSETDEKYSKDYKNRSSRHRSRSPSMESRKNHRETKKYDNDSESDQKYQKNLEKNNEKSSSSKKTSRKSRSRSPEYKKSSKSKTRRKYSSDSSENSSSFEEKVEKSSKNKKSKKSKRSKDKKKNRDRSRSRSKDRNHRHRKSSKKERKRSSSDSD